MSEILSNVIIIAVLLAIVGGALVYIKKNRKKGIKCVGCPYASGCSGGCSCSSRTKEKGDEKKA